MCVDHSLYHPNLDTYYFMFVDEYSHKCWIFFMQEKDQTFKMFFDFKALVEKESGNKVKAL